MPAKSDKFPLGVSRKIATSDEYADLTDHERSVLWTAAALLFEPLTAKRLARILNSKVDLALLRLEEQGFLNVVEGDIKLAERWLSVNLSTSRVVQFRARRAAADAAQDAATQAQARDPHQAKDKDKVAPTRSEAPGVGNDGSAQNSERSSD